MRVALVLVWHVCKVTRWKEIWFGYKVWNYKAQNCSNLQSLKYVMALSMSTKLKIIKLRILKLKITNLKSINLKITKLKKISKLSYKVQIVWNRHWQSLARQSTKWIAIKTSFKTLSIYLSLTISVCFFAPIIILTILFRTIYTASHFPDNIFKLSQIAIAHW